MTSIIIAIIMLLLMNIIFCISSMHRKLRHLGYDVLCLRLHLNLYQEKGTCDRE